HSRFRFFKTCFRPKETERSVIFNIIKFDVFSGFKPIDQQIDQRNRIKKRDDDRHEKQRICHSMINPPAIRAEMRISIEDVEKDQVSANEQCRQKQIPVLKM